MTTLTAATPTPASALARGPGMRAMAPVSSGLTGGDVARIVRCRLVLICAVWFFLIGVTVGVYAIVRIYYPGFSAQSLIRVESIAPPNVTDPLERDPAIRQEDIERELQNQVLLIKSPIVLQKAIKDPELRRTQWFKEAEAEVERTKNESIVDLLDDLVRASPIRDSNFIGVSATWRVQGEVPTLVNTVVRMYVEEIDSQQKDSIRRADEQLGDELGRARQLFESKKREIEAFRQTEEFSSLSNQEANETLLTLTALVTELEVEMLGRRTQWEALQNASPEDLPITAELQALLDQDPGLLQLEQAVMIAEQNLDRASSRFGVNHNIVRDAKRGLDAAAQRVAEERAIKIIKYQTRQIEQAQRNFLEAQEQLLKLKERLFEASAVQKDKDAKKARYENLLDERDLLRLQYQNLLEKKNLLSMTLRQSRTVQIEVQSRAIEPQRMSSPDFRIWIPAGTLFGLALSVGLAFLLELTDTSVRTPRDVMRSHLPVLGTIPTTDDDEVEIERAETASLDAPHSIVAEAFRNLRANLFFSAPAEQQGVILVTSPGGGNGKTTVASNLAISIALTGRRVLLIDANFPRASFPKIFPNMKPDGLSNILIGQGFLKDYATETLVPGLDVLGSGPIPPNPAELLGSSYLRDIVVDARSRYDLVIFDGPPLLMVSDAMVLAGAVDGCLLICQYRVTSRGALQRAQANLGAIDARIFGAVLNEVQTRAGGYFRKAYREFYEYHDHEPEEQDGRQASRPKLQASASRATPEAGGEAAPPSVDPGTQGGGGEASGVATEAGAGDAPGASGPFAAETPIEPGATGSDDLVDFGDMVDLDREADAGLGGTDEKPLTGPSGLGPAPWLEAGPEVEGEDTGDFGAAPDLGDQDPLADELTDLDGEDFKIDEDTGLDDDSEGRT